MHTVTERLLHATTKLDKSEKPEHQSILKAHNWSIQYSNRR